MRINKAILLAVAEKGRRLWVMGMFLGAACLFTFGACESNAASKSREAQQKDAADKISDGLQQAGEGVKDVANETGAAIKSERDDLSKRLNQKVKEIDAELNAVDLRIEKASAKEKVKYQERRNRLAQERDELNAAIKDLGKDMKNGWDDFKAEVNRTIDRIDKDLGGDN